MRRILCRTVDAMRRFPKIRCLRLENVRNERLRVPINYWEPRALDLHHQPVPLEERVILRVQAESVSRIALGVIACGLSKLR